MKTIAIKASRVLLWVIYAWVTVTLVLLLLAFFLQLFGANPTAGFVEWVYRATERAMAPFRGIFEPIELSDESVLDVSIVFAMIVYGFVALALNAGINWLSRLRFEDEQRRQLAAAQTSGSGPDHVVHLAGPSGVAARAVLTPQLGGTSIQFGASGLDPNRHYSVWLEGSGGGRVSAATFQPSAVGEAALSLSTPVALRDSQLFGLTALALPGEPASVDVVATRLT